MADQGPPAGGIDIYGSGFRVDVDYSKAIEGARQLDKLLTGIPSKVEAAVNKSLATITGMIAQVNGQLAGVGVGSGGGGAGGGSGDTNLIAPPSSRPKPETLAERSRSARAGVNIFDGITTPASASSTGRQIRGVLNRGTYSEVPLIGPVQPYSQPTAPRGPGPIAPMPFEMYGGNYRGRAQRLDYDYRRRAELDAAYWASRTMPPQLLPANITPYIYRPSDPRDPSHFRWPSGPNTIDRLAGEYGAFGQTTRPVYMQGRRADEGLVYVGGGGPAQYGMPGGAWTTDQGTARMAQRYGSAGGLVFVGGGGPAEFTSRSAGFAAENFVGEGRPGFQPRWSEPYAMEVGWAPSSRMGPPVTPGITGFFGDATRGIADAGSWLRRAAYVGAGLYGARSLAYGAAGLYNRTVGAAATEHQGRILLAETMVGGEVGLDFGEATRLANRLVDSRFLGSIGLSPAALGLNRAELADQYRQLAPIIRLNATDESQFREGLESGTLARQLLVARDPAQGTRGAMIALSELYSGGQDRFTSLSRRFELPRARMLEIEAELNATGAYYDPSRIVLQVLSEMGFTEEYARARALGTVQGQFAWTTAMASNVGLDTFSGSVNPLIQNLNTLNSALEMFTTSQSYVDMMAAATERIGGIVERLSAGPVRWAGNQAVRGSGFSPFQFSRGFDDVLDATGRADTPYFVGSGSDMGSAWDAFAYRAAELFADRATTLMSVAEISGRAGGSGTWGTSLLGALGLSMGLGAIGRGVGGAVAEAGGGWAGAARVGGRFLMRRVLPLAILSTGIEGARDARRNASAANLYGQFDPGLADQLIYEHMTGMSMGEEVSGIAAYGASRRAQDAIRILDWIENGNLFQRGVGHLQAWNFNFQQSMARNVWHRARRDDPSFAGLNNIMDAVGTGSAAVDSLAAQFLLGNPNAADLPRGELSQLVYDSILPIIGEDRGPAEIARLTRQVTDSVSTGSPWAMIGQTGISMILRESAARGEALNFNFGGSNRTYGAEVMEGLAGNEAALGAELSNILRDLGEDFEWGAENVIDLFEQHLGANSPLTRAASSIAGDVGDMASAMRGDGLRLSNQPNVFLGYDPNADWRNVNPVRGGLFGEVLSEAVTPHRIAQSLMAPPTMSRLTAALSPYATTVTGQSLGAPIPTLGAAANLAGRTPNSDSSYSGAARDIALTYPLVNPRAWTGRMGGSLMTMQPGQNYSDDVLAEHPHLANVNAAGGHSGVDLRIGKQGVSDPFFNPFDSTLVVVDVGDTGEKGRGKWATYYNTATGNYWQASHLDEMLTIGTNVAPGEILGLEGNTGSSTGYHLDWRMVSQVGTAGLGNLNAWGDVRDVNRGGLGAFSQAMLNEGLWMPDANTPPADTFMQGGDINLHIEVHGGGTAEENAAAFRREIHNMQRDGVFNALAMAGLHEYARRGMNADGTNPTERPSIANG